MDTEYARRTGAGPRPVPPRAVPPRPLVHRPAGPPAGAPAVPVTPSWGHRVLPVAVRGLLADLGWWQNPTPQSPSAHLVQVIAVLERYGWCQSLDVSPTGRVCQRGAMNLLERTGHVTPHTRDRAQQYLQAALAEWGVTMQFFAWNDLPDQTLDHVKNRLTRAAALARQNGE